MKAHMCAHPDGSQRRCDGGAPGQGPLSPGAAAGQHGLHLSGGVGGGTGGEVQEGWGSRPGPSGAGALVSDDPAHNHPTHGGAASRPRPRRPRPARRPCTRPGVSPLAAWVTPVPVRYSPRVTRAEESSVNSEKDVSFSSSFSFAQGLAVTSSAQ